MKILAEKVRKILNDNNNSKEKEKISTNDYFKKLLSQKMNESKSKLNELKNMTHLNFTNSNKNYHTSNFIIFTKIILS